MVIEDEAILLETITEKLQKSGMETISCTRAEQAIDYLKSLKELPHVIWLDYYLKGKMDGLDFMKEIKKNKKWSDIPIVIVSNTASDQKVKNMLALGAEKYLLKAEHRLDEIVSILEEIMKIDD